MLKQRCTRPRAFRQLMRSESHFVSSRKLGLCSIGDLCRHSLRQAQISFVFHLSSLAARALGNFGFEKELRPRSEMNTASRGGRRCTAQTCDSLCCQALRCSFTRPAIHPWRSIFESCRSAVWTFQTFFATTPRPASRCVPRMVVFREGSLGW